jgi:hypothetical protein
MCARYYRVYESKQRRDSRGGDGIKNDAQLMCFARGSNIEVSLARLARQDILIALSIATFTSNPSQSSERLDIFSLQRFFHGHLDNSLRHSALSNAKAGLFSPEPSTKRLPSDQGLYGLFQGTCEIYSTSKGTFSKDLAMLSLQMGSSVSHLPLNHNSRYFDARLPKMINLKIRLLSK